MAFVSCALPARMEAHLDTHLLLAPDYALMVAIVLPDLQIFQAYHLVQLALLALAGNTASLRHAIPNIIARLGRASCRRVLSVPFAIRLD